MATKTVTLRVNKDGTATIKVGRAIEHITVRDRPKAEIWDAIKYACISKGIVIKNEELVELLHEAGVE